MSDDKELPEFDEEKLLSILWEIANNTVSPLEFSENCKAELNEIILDGIEKIRNRNSGGEEAKENIGIFANRMKEKAEQQGKKVITPEILMSTLNELSPCWPFR